MKHVYPDILHHGAVGGTTGSCHELLCDEQRSVLVDCGLFQGTDVSPHGASKADLAIDFDISRVRALIATHVHIDHVGRIPWLLAAGFSGPILCSEPSARLLPIVLEDAFRLSFSRQPDKVSRYLKLIASRIQPLRYNHWHDVFSDKSGRLRIRLQRAGHILGSAYVECEVNSSAGVKRIVFSGDLGAPHAPLLPAPKPPYGCDTLVIESTYGDRQHEGRRDRRDRLQRVITRALRDQGTVLIPAFSIGRTQELIYELEDIIHRSSDAEAGSGLKWSELPIILDSPLASRFTRVYRDLTPYWEAEALKRVLAGRKPLTFDQLLTVDSAAAHNRMVKHLAETARPAVVISGSGMCTGGRIVSYLKAMLHDSRHNVLLVGYQAAGTPGRQLQQLGRSGGEMMLDGRLCTVKAPVDTLGGYSAHADQAGLVRFVNGMRKRPSEIRIVHGDEGAKAALQKKLPGAIIPGVH